MLHRMARPVLLTLLIVAGIGSAGFLWFTEQRIATVRQQAAAMETHADASPVNCVRRAVVRFDHSVMF